MIVTRVCKNGKVITTRTTKEDKMRFVYPSATDKEIHKLARRKSEVVNKEYYNELKKIRLLG